MISKEIKKRISRIRCILITQHMWGSLFRGRGMGKEYITISIRTCTLENGLKTILMVLAIISLKVVRDTQEIL